MKVTIVKTWTTMDVIDVPDELNTDDRYEDLVEHLEQNYDKVASVAVHGINQNVVSWEGTEATMTNGEYIIDWTS